MQKVVYFDEGSATDILQIEYGGTLISVNEDKGTVHFGGKAEGAAEAGIGTNFFTAIKASFTAKISADSAHSKDSLITKTISNTILADFHSLSERLITEKKISMFNGYKMKAIKNSFSFIKMYAPYMKIFKEDSPYMEEMKDFDVQNINEILENARGYYELLAYKDIHRVILRFNITAFKNAYSLMDLPRMKLVYFAVEVGEGKETDFDIQNEMSTDVNTNRLSVEDILENSDRLPEQEGGLLKMYDVILAGVEAENS